MKKLGRILRTALGIFMAIGTVVYVWMAFTEPKVRVPIGIMAVLFGVGAFFLLRRKKEPQASVEADTWLPEVPEDILKDMRRSYTVMQAKDDARIMSESFSLVQRTTDIEVFVMRLELARKKALTLLQAERAGCKGIKQMRVGKACAAVLSSAQNAKLAFLDSSYQKETSGALLLKTQAGQRKRLEAYLKKLEDHRIDFMDVEDAFEQTMEKVKELMP